MKKFMILYHSAVSAVSQMANANPEQTKSSMAAWIAWRDSCGDAMVDFGMPLQFAKHIVSGADSNVSGYSILQAETAEAVTKLLENHPHLDTPTSSIEILEVLPLPGT